MKLKFCALLLAVSVTLPAFAEDGELFPNVKSYDQEVQAPVSHPEKTFEKPKPLPIAILPKPLPAPKETTPPPPPAPTIRWSPYRTTLLAPLLSPESQALFDKDFAPRLKIDLKAAKISKSQAAETLWKDAEAATVPPDLKRVLWLDALGLSIQGQTKLEERAEKAKAVLPLLQEETLPAAQARADAVTELAFGALANASDALLAIVLESQCKLARMQIQGGFPDEAGASIKAARDAFRFLKQKTDSQKDLLAEASAWVDRAIAARAALPAWQKTLAAKPADPFVNTQLAVLNLSLYGDVEKAAKYATKSDRKEFLAFAAAVGGARTPATTATASAQTDFQSNLPAALSLCSALLDLADTAVPFDRYSIASLVQFRLADISAAAPAEASQTARAEALHTRATDLIEKSGFHNPSFPALAALASLAPSTTAPGGTPSVTAPASDKLVLFVKDGGTVVKYVKPTPKQDAEALALFREQAKTLSEKLNLKFTEIETPHCIIFTDWKPVEHTFLKKNVEAAYVGAAKLFDFPLTENVFPGKLPLYELAGKEEFITFGKQVGRNDLARAGGCFDINDQGIGYIFSFQQLPNNRMSAQDCLIQWGHGLAWDMTTAFSARYRTNQEVPGWLGIGLSAHVSFYQFEPARVKIEAQYFLASKKSLTDLLTNGAHTYRDQAIIASFVDMLLAKDSKAFVTLINKVKDGAKVPEAFQETYKLSYDDAEKLWKSWTAKQNP